MLAASGAQRQGHKWQCPAHGREEGHSVALSVTETVTDHRALVHCFAGCSFDDVLAALRITRADLRVTPPTSPERHARRALRGYVWPAPADGGGSPAERGFRFECWHP